MIKASGIMYLTPDRQALFLKRGNGSDHPGEWCWPGGQVEYDETLEAAALRESQEECGFAPDAGAIHAHTRSVAPATPVVTNPAACPCCGGSPCTCSPDCPNCTCNRAPSEDVDFTTFKCRVPEPFPVVLCDEHTGYAWASVDGPPEPLHPGCRLAIDRLTMNELGVARAMAAGQLTSPQRYDNVWLFNIRITGTGISYRPSIKEFVWRPPEVWMTDEAMARANGLVVIWEHPEKSLLNSKEFNRRAVGTVFLPFLRPEVGEMWAVVKIYDDEAAEDMATNGLSTSPAVNFPTGVNTRIEVDGKKMLLEGEPTLLDHIAICTRGVWDKEGEAEPGVETSEVEAIADDYGDETWHIHYMGRNGSYRKLPDARFHSKEDAERYIVKYHSKVTHKAVRADTVMADSAVRREPPLGQVGLAVAAFRLNVASRLLSGRHKH